jgi:hypothetical protein
MSGSRERRSISSPANSITTLRKSGNLWRRISLERSKLCNQLERRQIIRNFKKNWNIRCINASASILRHGHPPSWALQIHGGAILASHRRSVDHCDPATTACRTLQRLLPHTRVSGAEASVDFSTSRRSSLSRITRARAR